jgi:acetyl esterase/lipase
METVKEKKKHKGLKIMGIIIAAIAAIVIIGIIVINLMLRPVSDTSDKAVPVGGLLVSDSIDYHVESADGLNKNLIIQIMQLVWKSCNTSDAKVHETQTPPEVHMEKDIPYIDDGNFYHYLDVMYPEGTTDKLPVIIDIHGGGWMYATKDLNEYYNRALADRGFVVFSISYRLVPDVTVNEQLQDCAVALKWISEHMAEYPCDTDSIMLTGDSAGGMLAIYSEVLMQSAELREIFEVEDGGLDVDALLLTSPAAFMKGNDFMSMYTKLLWGKNYKDKPTYNYMNVDEIIDYAEAVPPTYLITSSGDALAHDATHKLYDLLVSKGVDATLRDYDDYNGKALPHVFSILEPFDEIGKETIDDAVAFYREVIA